MKTSISIILSVLVLALFLDGKKLLATSCLNNSSLLQTALDQIGNPNDHIVRVKVVSRKISPNSEKTSLFFKIMEFFDSDPEDDIGSDFLAIGIIYYHVNVSSSRCPRTFRARNRVDYICFQRYLRKVRWWILWILPQDPWRKGYWFHRRGASRVNGN